MVILLHALRELRDNAIPRIKVLQGFKERHSLVQSDLAISQEWQRPWERDWLAPRSLGKKISDQLQTTHYSSRHQGALQDLNIVKISDLA